MSNLKQLVRIIGDSSHLENEFNKAKKKARSFAADSKKVLKGVGVAFAGIATGAGASVAAIYSDQADELDRMAKTADKLGILPEKLVGIQHAAEQTGVGLTQANQGLQRMVRRVSEAAKGTGAAVKPLKELGLSAERLNQLSPDQQFSAIADAMGRVEKQSDRVRLAMGLFDTEGVALVNTLALGSEGLAAMATEADQLGIALNRVELAKIEAANDEFDRAKKVSSAFGKVLTAELAPYIGAIAKEFTEASKESGGFSNMIGVAVDSTVTGIGFILDAVRGLRTAWKGLTLIFARSWEVILNGMAKVEQGIRSLLDFLPGVQVEATGAVSEIARTMSFIADDIEKEFDDLTLSPMPSEKIKKWVQDVRDKADAAAKEVAANRNGNIMASITGLDQVNLTPDEIAAANVNNAKDDIKNNNTRNPLSKVVNAELTEIQKKSIQVGNTLKAQIGTGLNQALQGDFKSILNGFKNMVLQMVNEAIAANIVGALGFGAGAGGSAGAGSFGAAFASLLSFDGGGYTGSGTRTGGVDGRGGFPAILHPNETVIDNTKNQSSSSNVINITNNYSGPVDEGVIQKSHAQNMRSMKRALARV